MYTVHFAAAAAPLGWLDAVATCMCVGGLLMASLADNQLRQYMLTNAQGTQPVPVRVMREAAEEALSGEAVL